LRKKALQITFRDQLNQLEENVSVDISTYNGLVLFLFYHLTHDMDAVEVTREDIKVFLRKEKDVQAAQSMLDVTGDGKVTLEDCVGCLERVYHERCNLASTLRDTRSITNVLELLIGIVIHTIFVFFYLLIFRQNVSSMWVGFTGLLVAVSWAFASTVSSVFSNVVFIFGVHAYDVGDTLLIDNQWLTVDELTMNFTVCVSGYILGCTIRIRHSARPSLSI
jgi:small-conductance mechanosensitive channel